MDPLKSLTEDICYGFERACREHDLEVAEFLFQALEAIAKRQGEYGLLDSAFEELVHAMLPAANLH